MWPSPKNLRLGAACWRLGQSAVPPPTRVAEALVRPLSSAGADVDECLGGFEALVQQDPGQRGIHAFTQPQGELSATARELWALHERPTPTLAVLTGFPCNLDHRPPTETDGPLGAIAVARAFLAAHRFSQPGRPNTSRVVLVTDDCNRSVMQAALDASGQVNTHSRLRVEVQSFPPAAEWDDGTAARLDALADSVDHVLAIERTGPGADGGYYTMRGKNMDDVVAPLERLLQRPGGVRSTGIGDGGNELGMGKALPQILASDVPRADRVACVVPTDNLLVCSVSNWGGYALAAALAVLAAETHHGALLQRDPTALRRLRALDAAWSCMLPHAFDEGAVMDAILSAGARDGVTRKSEHSVDGLPFDDSLAVLDQLRAQAEAHFQGR